jgi:hypothetical protein
MRPAMRRTAVTLALLVAGALLGACGRSNPTPSSAGTAHAAKTKSHTGTAGAAPTSSGRSFTKTQALAFAHAVNLTSADVPGFKPSTEHHHETAVEQRRERELQGCTGGASNGGGNLAELSSPDFKLEHGILDLSVNSEVSVARTSALAAKGLATIRSTHFRECLSRYLDLLFKEQSHGGTTVGPISIVQGTPPAPGATGSFGWRITATITARGVKLPFYQDMLGFVYGSAEVSLVSSGALRPFPAAIQQQLFSLLVKRAKAAGGQ